MKVIYEPKGRAREYTPLACNLYTTCTHSCVYCYVPLVLRTTAYQFHKQQEPREGIIGAIRNDAKELMERGITQKNVLLSFICDPYQDGNSHIAGMAIDALHEYDIPVTVLTKGGINSLRDLHKFRSGDEYAISLTTTRDNFAGILEPMAASPTERIATLKEFHDAGVYTWVSLEPIITIRDTMRSIMDTLPYTDEYRIGPCNYVADNDWWYYMLPNETELKEFAEEFTRMMKRNGKKYLLKEDMKQLLDE